MSFYIATIPFKEWITDPMQRPIVYVSMIEWCKENIEPRHQPESPRYWFPRAFRGRTGVYKFHFRDEQDYNNFVQHFKLEGVING
jgi:hypothetical protein